LRGAGLLISDWSDLRYALLVEPIKDSMAVRFEIITTPDKHKKGLTRQAEGHQPSLKLWRGKRKITEI